MHRGMTSAGMIVLTFVLLSGCGDNAMNASAPLKRMEPFAMKQFVIGTWPFSSRATEAFCTEAQAAGFNTLVDAPGMLDVADKTGMKIIITTMLNPVTDEKTGKWTGGWKLGPFAHLEQLKWFDERWGKHPALAGYLLNDNCKLHDYTVECGRWLRANRPWLIPYMSHNPNADEQGKVADALPIISTQNYPYGFHNDWPEAKKRRDFCDRLEADRANANKYDMVLWPIFAVYGKPDLGASQIRFQAFSSVAYGAQGLFYFAYSGRRPAWRKGGSVVTAVTYCNDYIVPEVAPRVLGCRSIGVFHGAADTDAPDGSLPIIEDAIVEDLDADALAGVLVPEKTLAAGRHLPAYVMLVNKRTATDPKRQPPARDVSVTFGTNVRKVTILGDDHRTGTVAGNTATVTLAGGDGVLLRIE